MQPDPITAEILGKGPFARREAPYGLVRVEGPDAGDYLQRLCSQDVSALAISDLQPAAFLDGKGKVKFTCRVLRDDAGLWLETDAEQVEPLRELLDHFHFAERLQLEAISDRSCREVIQAAGAGGDTAGYSEVGEKVLVTRCVRRGVQFERTYATEHAPGAEAELPNELAECLRVAAGFVRVGVDTEPNTLALEADLDDHCSRTKGCYTGQEIVARIDTYGHTNRKLCFLQLAEGPELLRPAPLHEPEDDLPVGRVMRAVPVPGHPMRFALGYLPEDFQAAGTRLRLEDGADATVVW